jgi:cell division septation protein DedD
MNRNAARGLVILVAIIIVAVVLWRFYYPGSLTVGPGPVATSQPAVTPAPAPPGAKPPTPQGLPPIAPVKPEAAHGIAPLQEPSAPAPKITFPATPPLGEKYGILVGEYRKYPQAAKMLTRLKKRGQPAFVQRDPRDSSRFQVWLGPFSSQDEARAAQKAMRARLKKPLKIEAIENPGPK